MKKSLEGSPRPCKGGLWNGGKNRRAIPDEDGPCWVGKTDSGANPAQTTAFFGVKRGFPRDGPIRERFPKSTDADIMMLVPPKKAKYTERRA
jgi:hypothetical protein